MGIKTVKQYDVDLEKAALEYIDRKNRDSHPSGTFDNANRWEPDDDEWCECCKYIRSPSRAYPYSLMVHCRTIEHVANLFGVDKTDLRKKVREMQKQKAA